MLDEIAERPLELAAGVEMRLGADQRVHQLRNLLLEGGADVLHHRGLEVRALARLEHGGDRQRHLSKRIEVGGESAHQHRRALAGLLTHLVEQLENQFDGGEIPLRPAALEAELGGHLLPPVAVLAHPQLLGHEGVLVVHLVEVVSARQVVDGPDGDAFGVAEVHEELGEALVLLVRHHLGAEQRDGEVGEMRVARPDLGAVHLVAARHLLGAGADGGQVRARVGLAHPDGERQLPPRDGRQEALALLLRAEAQQQRAGLAIGHPVGADRRAGGEGLLEHDVALQERALVAAVLLGPRHADPALGGELLRKLRMVPTPSARPLFGGELGQLRPEELADLLAQLFRLGRQLVKLEVERGHGRVLSVGPTGP